MIRLFRVFVPTSVVGLLLIETLLIFGLYSAVLFLRTDFSAEIYLVYEGGFGRVAIVTASILLGLYRPGESGDRSVPVTASSTHKPGRRS